MNGLYETKIYNALSITLYIFCHENKLALNLKTNFENLALEMLRSKQFTVFLLLFSTSSCGFLEHDEVESDPPMLPLISELRRSRQESKHPSTTTTKALNFQNCNDECGFIIDIAGSSTPSNRVGNFVIFTKSGAKESTELMQDCM